MHGKVWCSTLKKPEISLRPNSQDGERFNLTQCFFFKNAKYAFEPLLHYTHSKCFFWPWTHRLYRRDFIGPTCLGNKLQSSRIFSTLRILQPHTAPLILLTHLSFRLSTIAHTSSHCKLTFHHASCPFSLDDDTPAGTSPRRLVLFFLRNSFAGATSPFSDLIPSLNVALFALISLIC